MLVSYTTGPHGSTSKRKRLRHGVRTTPHFYGWLYTTPYTFASWTFVARSIPGSTSGRPSLEHPDHFFNTYSSPLKQWNAVIYNPTIPQLNTVVYDPIRSQFVRPDYPNHSLRIELVDSLEYRRWYQLWLWLWSEDGCSCMPWPKEIMVLFMMYAAGDLPFTTFVS
jgi:hypothetical protein